MERSVTHGKLLNSLGKWWGAKPFVLTRALVLAALFEAAVDPEYWPADLEVFLKLMCFDNAGMWKRKTESLPASLCWSYVQADEVDLFLNENSWGRLQAADKRRKESLERRVFYTLPHAVQRKFCCRVEEIDGPPAESWAEINSYCGTTASTLQEWVEQVSYRRFGRRIRVGDAFCGMGSIPFEAAVLGCDVVASDLNPVASLLTWGGLNVIAGESEFHRRVVETQATLYDEINRWFISEGLEYSEEGWRAALYFYCAEITVPEWDNWKIPIAPTWQIAPKLKAWVELVPNTERKAFDFKVRYGGEGFSAADKGTKQGSYIACPPALWSILHSTGKSHNAVPQIKLKTLIDNHGGLRRWEKTDIVPRSSDFYGERLYCIRWLKAAALDDDGRRLGRDQFYYREPSPSDLSVELEIQNRVTKELEELQTQGFIPDWRIKDGYNTDQIIRERGWAYWHQLFNPRQLLMAAEYSKRIAKLPVDLRAATTLNIGLLLNYNSRLCHWHEKAGGGVGSTGRVFYNNALNTFPSYPARSWASLESNLKCEHVNLPSTTEKAVALEDARKVQLSADLWITDPPYADAVNYEELAEFFLAWYKPHIEACFPEWYTDSRRDNAVKGQDVSFRVAMAEAYENLSLQMPDSGTQILMFTHKNTEVWEDLALIMWTAGLQVKQVWSIATETGAGAVKDGNFVQATYNMVLRKRPKDAPMGFVDLVIPQINARVTQVISHMRDSQTQSGNATCGYTDTDYLLAAQAVAAEVVTGYSSIDGIDLEEELRTPNKERGDSVLRNLMTQAKRTAVDFLVPYGLEENLKRSPDGTNAYQFWRSLSPEEKFLLKSLELEAGGVDKIGAFQDLGRAYGITDYEELMGPIVANEARSKLPDEFPRADPTRWDDVPVNSRSKFDHSVTRHMYHSLKLLMDGADIERAVKHLVDSTNFWNDRQGRHLVLLGYIYQTTESIDAWTDIRPLVQTLRLAVENRKA